MKSVKTNIENAQVGLLRPIQLKNKRARSFSSVKMSFGTFKNPRAEGLFPLPETQLVFLIALMRWFWC